ncbi:DUF1461 domain-containing protein [Eubacteriales bacterium OttesenSCG-928-A19]|nr:DUF1461 domain-containing protein [Eubacteriales bacterium OttesenSCG-928-A19]
MKRLGVIAGSAAGLLLLVALLYLAVASFALRAESYPQTPPFDGMADALVRYLSGDASSLPDTLFTERERLHMVDVLGLFMGAKRLAIGCACAGLALAALAWFLGGLRRLGTGLLLGMAAFGVLALCVGLWAAIDFNGWFTAMHLIAFDNDLWLLDPAESMLIRMLPLSFFIDAVKTVALRFGLGALLLLLAALLLRRFGGKKEIAWTTSDNPPSA